jgi:hypothetical protein
MDRIDLFEVVSLGFRAAVLCLFLVGSLSALFPGS